MNLRDHAVYALQRSRWFTASILDAFAGDDWFFQPHPKCNHAMWILGHLGLADNMFATTFRADAGRKPDGWDELFWFGSTIRSDAAAYPALDDVRAYFDERREALIKLIPTLTDDELDAPAPLPDALSPIAGAPGMGHLLLFGAVHENLHAGQLTVLHRALGNPPIFGP